MDMIGKRIDKNLIWEDDKKHKDRNILEGFLYIGKD